MSARPWPYWMHSVAHDPSAIVFFFVVVCEVVPTGWTDFWWIFHSSWWALRNLWAAELCCFSMMAWNCCLWAGDTLRRCGVPIFHGRCRPASPGRVSLGQYLGSGNGLFTLTSMSSRKTQMLEIPCKILSIVCWNIAGAADTPNPMCVVLKQAHLCVDNHKFAGIFV